MATQLPYSRVIPPYDQYTGVRAAVCHESVRDSSHECHASIQRVWGIMTGFYPMMAVVAKIGAARSALPLIEAKERAFAIKAFREQTRGHILREYHVGRWFGGCIEQEGQASSALYTNQTPPASPVISSLTDVPTGALESRKVYGNARTNVSNMGVRKYGS